MKTKMITLRIMQVAIIRIIKMIIMIKIIRIMAKMMMMIISMRRKVTMKYEERSKLVSKSKALLLINKCTHKYI